MILRLALLLSLFVSGTAFAADLNKRIPAPRSDPANGARTATAVLAGGCFWGQQGVFQHVKGVTRVVSGYSGGSKETATYSQVITETTGHAEAIEITYDPRVISYGKLLQIFFSVAHDPTEVDRQGPDIGPSYRTAIFPTSRAQGATARAYIAQLNAARIFPRPIATKIEDFKGFYRAEDYHQDFLVLNPTYPYIVYNDLPKVAALKRVWPQYWREKPVLLTAPQKPVIATAVKKPPLVSPKAPEKLKKPSF
jgi:peptide-methionine (S)-S-oxide reductase